MTLFYKYLWGKQIVRKLKHIWKKLLFGPLFREFLPKLGCKLFPTERAILINTNWGAEISSTETFPLTSLLGSVSGFSEPVFVDLLRSPGIDFQPGGSVWQLYLSYPLARIHRLAELIPRTQFLGPINVHKHGLWLSFAPPPPYRPDHVPTTMCYAMLLQGNDEKWFSKRNETVFISF